MKFPSWLPAAALAGSAAAIQQNVNVYETREATSKAPALPDMAVYNFSMPVDHFDQSNTKTYNNRYYVNDTYYKQGGPVIFFDAGERGLDDGYAGQFLAEYNGTKSAPMQLAAKLNGLVIGWEHRYYGFSQPVDINVDLGIPQSGPDDYKFLTLEQGLEDLVYFANRFNTTTLEKNSVIKNTTNLDPYNTPWIHIGGSYTGSRGAWARQRNPEIFYASWASSAPVQVQEDGSPYWNQVSRGLPKNCTNDLKAISAYVDEKFTKNETSKVRLIQAATWLMRPDHIEDNDITDAYKLTPGQVVNIMFRGILDGSYQTYGPADTVGVFCTYLEQFNVSQYRDSRNKMGAKADLRAIAHLALENNGTAKYTDDGIAASTENGPEIATAAFSWAYYQYTKYRQGLKDARNQAQNIIPTNYTRTKVDTQSWEWQVLSQMGWFQFLNPNASTAFFNSKYIDQKEFVNFVKKSYPSDFKFPDKVNTSYPMKWGGWDMKPSNVMFTNGEFDPWRAFSVSSTEDNSPKRKTTTDVPKCNTPPNDNDVFGLVYKGAVHVEDMSIPVTFNRASQEDPKPLQQGLDLFVKAYNAWQPCFNASRDAVRNGKSPDGQGNSTTNPDNKNGTDSSNNKNNTNVNNPITSNNATNNGTKNDTDPKKGAAATGLNTDIQQLGSILGLTLAVSFFLML